MSIAKRELIWPIDATVAERFWLKVDKRPGYGPTGTCWFWLAAKDRDGYGGFGVDGIWHRATRVAYVLKTKRALSVDLLVRHKCDWPSCVRPSHLLVGTSQDNVADKTLALEFGVSTSAVVHIVNRATWKQL
jgi:hypothetical protein